MNISFVKGRFDENGIVAKNRIGIHHPYIEGFIEEEITGGTGFRQAYNTLQYLYD